MWLSVLLAWFGVRWFDAGMGWVWTGFVLTSAPASILVWWIFRQRISDYERGRRELPEVDHSPRSLSRLFTTTRRGHFRLGLSEG